jgi:DNA-binding CsgD family transcriptional regulator
MAESKTMDEQDVRSMMCLAGEIGEISRNGSGRVGHLLDGLRTLLGARVAAWFITADDSDGHRQLKTVIDRGWGSEHERAGYARYLAADLTKDPLHDAVEHWHRVSPVDVALNTNWRDHFTPEEYYRHSFVQDLLRPNGLDELLLYKRHTGQPGTTIGIAIFREWDDPRPFTTRDKAVVDLLYSSCAHLIENAHSHPVLSPRAQQVLHCLLEGDSVKQVALRLDLSPHTVTDHVKAIYKRYNVGTRGELLARFVRA